MKNKRNKGFTLAELLIVIAIVGVLVSISIPIFAAQRDNVNAAVDAANIKSAESLAIADCMLDNNYNTDRTYYYDADNGVIKVDCKDISTYGKSDKKYDNADGIAKGCIIKLVISPNRKIKSVSWVSAEGGVGSLPKNIRDFVDSVTKNDWDTYQKDKAYSWGVEIDPGTVITDGDKMLVFFSNNDYYGREVTGIPMNEISFDEMSKQFENRVVVIDDKTKILSHEEGAKELPGKKWGRGTIAEYGDDYYILKQNMGYNKWTDLENIVTDGNWAKIKCEQL